MEAHERLAGHPESAMLEEGDGDGEVRIPTAAGKRRRRRTSSCCSSSNSSIMRRTGRRPRSLMGGTRRLSVAIGLLLLLVLFEGTPSIYAAEPQMQAPRFTTQPSSSGSMVNEGRTKILQCHALGYPQPMYRWLKNGVPVGIFKY